ncbi:hypothetical protein [Anabaena azotica]|uniref:Uncharacterized protein n=1 Tax=Anabaena azotica FACHB-119 TaxID=947527 RepID=A0ABR8D8D2_9NOST|nr:hypothetical protein [Anabaena azotica]MBD2503432.1 hypothetical protein [Anabaena azotica FACHB-119]
MIALLIINPPEHTSLVSFVIHNLKLQSLPRTGEKFNISVQKELAEAFEFLEDEVDVDLVITDIKHIYDVGEGVEEHIIKIHACIDPTFWGTTYGGEIFRV